MLVSLMGSSILGEVDDTSIPRTGLSNGYWDPVDRLPASRLLLPRSGLERSDFVRWHIASFRFDAQFGRYRCIADSGKPRPVDL